MRASVVRFVPVAVVTPGAVPALGPPPGSPALDAFVPSLPAVAPLPVPPLDPPADDVLAEPLPPPELVPAPVEGALPLPDPLPELPLAGGSVGGGAHGGWYVQYCADARGGAPVP